jgi:hypothetical protein
MWRGPWGPRWRLCTLPPGRVGVGGLVSLALLTSALFGVTAGVVAGRPTPAGAATTETCSFATPGTGTYASTLCWFDLSAYNATAAAAPGGQSVSVSLPGGYTIAFDLHVSGRAVTPVPFPTFGDGYLGNNGHYTGVAGNTALYQNQNGSSSTTTATLDNISVVDAGRAALTGYAFVGADAESTDSNESITWTSNTPLSLLSTLGNSCNSGALLTGLGTTTVKCAATVSGTKTGTPILAAQAPTTMTQTMVGSGRQAVAFGVLVSTVQLTKAVVDRVDPTDAFGVAVSTSSGSELASADTDTGASATTGPVTVLTSNQGSNYLLSDQITSGQASNYTGSWSCTRNGAADANLPSGDAGPSATVTLGIGDFVNCTITNTGKPVSLALDKHADPPDDVDHDGLTNAGDTVDYTFTVTNTGALALANISVGDDKVGAVSCPEPVLEPGESETCTAAPYTITAADQVAGAVDNTAVASGTPPGSTIPIASPPSSTTTPVGTPAPAVSIDKTGSASGGDGNSLVAGEIIDYSYLVTNIGNVNLTSVAVDDPTLDPGIGTVTCPALPAPGLAPGDSVACTAAPYTVLVNGATLVDTATATGTSVDGDTPPSDPSTVTLPSAPDPTVALEKTAAVTPAADQDGYRLGDTVAYSYKVTNIGNVDLGSVAVDDPTLGPVSCPTPAPPGLVPGDSVTCTADEQHTVTQADVDAGHLTDTATATGTDVFGGSSPPSDPSTVTLPADPPTPQVTLDKTAAVTPEVDGGGLHLGDSVAYSYQVTNTGNVTLSSVAVDDPTLGPVSCPTPAPPGLGPGDSVTCTADEQQTIAQADVDAGQVTDTATATGTDTTGEESPPSDPSTVTIPTVASPLVSIVKSAEVSPFADQDAANLGDSVAYSYQVTNTGSVTLTSVAVDDPTLGPVSCPPLPSIGLGPQGTVTCTAVATHTVTQADIDVGRVVDTATATGVATNGTMSPPSDPSTAIVPTVAAAPAVSLVKVATVSPPADQDGAGGHDLLHLPGHRYRRCRPGVSGCSGPDARHRHLSDARLAWPPPRRHGDLQRCSNAHRDPGRCHIRPGGRHGHRHRRGGPGRAVPALGAVDGHRPGRGP